MTETYKGIETIVILANGEEANLKINMYSDVTTILLDNTPLFTTDTTNFAEVAEIFLKRFKEGG